MVWGFLAGFVLALALGAGVYFGFIHEDRTLEDPDPALMLEIARLRRDLERITHELTTARAWKADDGLTVGTLKAQLSGQQAATDMCYQELYAAQAETKHLQAVIVDLRLEIASLQAVIEQDGRMPGYAAHIRKHERGAVARRLYADGLSKRQTMRQVWGYVGSSALAQLNRALQSG